MTEFFLKKSYFKANRRKKPRISCSCMADVDSKALHYLYDNGLVASRASRGRKFPRCSLLGNCPNTLFADFSNLQLRTLQVLNEMF